MANWVWRWALILGVIATPGLALAQAERLERLVAGCGPAGAYGYRFGSDSIAGEPSPAFGRAAKVAAADDWSDFEGFEVLLTLRTHKVYGVVGWATFDGTSGAVRAAEEMTNRLVAGSAWRSQPRVHGEARFTATDGAGLQLLLSVDRQEVVVICADLRLRDENAREVYEAEPEVTERPEPPVFVEGPRIDSAVCAQFDRRGALPQPIVDGFERWMGYARKVEVYEERLATWWSRRLAEGGAWTKVEAVRRRQDFETNPEFARLALANGEELDRLVLAWTHATDPWDGDAQSCRELVSMLNARPKAEANNETQWRMIEAFFAGEAAKVRN